MPLSAISAILSDNIFLSSGRTSSDTTSYPFFSTISRIAGPLKSSRSPRYPVSLDVMIATLFSFIKKPPCRADKFFRYLPFCISIIHISFSFTQQIFCKLQSNSWISKMKISTLTTRRFQPDEYWTLPYACQLPYTYHKSSEASPEPLSVPPFPHRSCLLFSLYRKRG